MISVLSFSSIVTSATNSIGIQKPPGLESGNLMAAFVSGYTFGSVDQGSYTAPTGWTKEAEVGVSNGSDNNNALCGFFTKIAGAGDTTTSVFTWTATNSKTYTGQILRISGSRPGSILGKLTPFANTDYKTDAISPLVASVGGTPDLPNSMLFIGLGSTAHTTASTYGVAVSNPTWTECFDYNNASFAYAIRPESTPTGNVSLDFSGTAPETVLILANISPAVSSDWISSVIAVPATIQQPTLAGGAVVSAGVATATTSVITPQAKQADWSPLRKSDTSVWSNLTKS